MKYYQNFQIYAICGNASSNSINGKVLQQSCENARKDIKFSKKNILSNDT